MAMRPELRCGARGSRHPGEPAAVCPARPAGFCPPPRPLSCSFRSLQQRRGQPEVQSRGHELKPVLRVKLSSPNRTKRLNEHFLSETLEDLSREMEELTSSLVFC